MKRFLLLILGTVVCLAGLTPATADARTVVVHHGRYYHRHRYYRHRRWVAGHYYYRHGRRHYRAGYYTYY